MSDVYLGGKFVGTIDDPQKFVSDLKEQRRTNLLSGNVNFYHDERADAVHVEAFRGRLRRPLIVVKDGVPILTEEHERKLERNELKWSDLVNQGIIEYLDAAEEENAYVAFFENELTIVVDSWLDRNAFIDTLRVHKKVLMICDTNNFSKGAHQVVIGNNKSVKSLGLIFYLLARGYIKSKKLKTINDIPDLEWWTGE